MRSGPDMGGLVDPPDARVGSPPSVRHWSTGTVVTNH